MPANQETTKLNISPPKPVTKVLCMAYKWCKVHLLFSGKQKGLQT